jgi:triphosphatase
MPTPSIDPTETELKFALGPGARHALETGLLRDGTASDLVATYFDTPDLALFNRGYGLRVRRKDGRFIQTLKSAGDGFFARGEWEAEVSSLAIDADVLAASPAAHIAAVEALAPLFEVRVRRIAALVSHGATRIEAVLDIGEVSVGDRREAIEELELELVDGAAADLFAFARTLDAPLTLAFETKSERGYRLARDVAVERHGPQAALRRLSAAIAQEDNAAAAMAAAELGVAIAIRAEGAFERPLWARILLDAAERTAGLPAGDTRV